jgi:hypothetical protein
MAALPRRPYANISAVQVGPPMNLTAKRKAFLADSPIVRIAIGKYIHLKLRPIDVKGKGKHISVIAYDMSLIAVDL